jgi:hypothetical protein
MANTTVDTQAEFIQKNWGIFLEHIENYITGERQTLLKNMYESYSERILTLPASHKESYHNAFPGGYIDHVNRVVKGALNLYYLWEEMGSSMEGFTIEELVFSAINHDLGKIGDEDDTSYLPQENQWRRDNLGEKYMYNKELAFVSVPDRSLYLLQRHNIKYSLNEMIAIQTHDGLYDSANEKYLKPFLPEQKPRNSLPYILHFADMMASRIEFENEWLSNFKPKNKNTPSSPSKKNSIPTKSKALNTIKSENLKSMLNNI